MSPINRKEITQIIHEGNTISKKLPQSQLKDKILDHFKKLQLLSESNTGLWEVEQLAKQLVIGVNEAITFGDMEILVELESEVCEAISCY